jgi:hypothetical protein
MIDVAIMTAGHLGRVVSMVALPAVVTTRVVFDD